VSFQHAIHAALGTAAFCPGLQALRPADRPRVRAAQPRDLRGSADIDAALQASLPNAPRWDYAIATRQNAADKVYWAEVHPAQTSEVGAVLAKLQWLRSWLRSSAPALAALPGEFVWIATAAVNILPNSPQARALAQSGLRPPVGQLQLR
jgi:hypothetical protein